MRMRQEKRVCKRTVIAGRWQKMKSYATGALCLLTVCLAACSNEDEEGGGLAGYGKTANEMLPVANAGIEFPVTTVYNNSRVADAFSYKNGCMNSAFDYNQETIKFYSNPLTVKKVIHTSYSTETEEYKNIRVNSAGFITSCNNDYSYIDEEETFTEHWDITIAYDNEGHMVLEKYKYTDSDGGSGNGTVAYTWEEGNLIKLSSTEIWNYDGEEETWRYEEEYTYDETLYPNPGVYHFYDYQTIGIGRGSFTQELLYAGLLGKPTKNIPISYKESQYDDRDFYDYTTEGVNYNDDGSISDIRSGYVRTYSGFPGNYVSGNYVAFDYDTDWDNDYDQLLPNYNRQKKSIASGSRFGRRGLSLRRKVMERNAQRNNTY